jgi:hypothetical protein
MWGRIIKILTYLLPYLIKLINFIVSKFQKNKIMAEEFKGAMSPETEKKLDSKLKFKNKLIEAVDGLAVKTVDNYLLSPLIEKLPEDVRPVVIEALAAVVDEMPEVEI